MNKARREGGYHLSQVWTFEKMAMEEGNGISSYIHSSSAGEGYTFWTSQSRIDKPSSYCGLLCSDFITLLVAASAVTGY